MAHDFLASGEEDYEGRKRELYYEYGCRELWIVDPDELSILQPVGGEAGWVDALAKRGDVLVSRVLGGFRLDVGDLAYE